MGRHRGARDADELVELQRERVVDKQCARAELAELAAERARLPLRELDAIEQERARLRGQRDDVAARLAALPAPKRSVLGRTKDPHAAERARLAASADGADRQLAALDSKRERLTAATANLPAAREQRAALDDREARLQRGARELVDQLAERDVLAPPTWARETFGEPPDSPARRRAVGPRRTDGSALPPRARRAGRGPRARA